MFNVGYNSLILLNLITHHLVLWISTIDDHCYIIRIVLFILKEHGGINWKINKPDKITI